MINVNNSGDTDIKNQNFRIFLPTSSAKSVNLPYFFLVYPIFRLLLDTAYSIIRCKQWKKCTVRAHRGLCMKKLLFLLLLSVLCLALISCGVCKHADTDCDGKCDSCGADFGSAGCNDEDGDGVCDVCGKTLDDGMPKGSVPLAIRLRVLALDVRVNGLGGVLARAHGQNDRGRAGNRVAAGIDV